MPVLTLVELFRLTKIELCDLATKIANDIPKLVEGTQHRENASIVCANALGANAAVLCVLTTSTVAGYGALD